MDCYSCNNPIANPITVTCKGIEYKSIIVITQEEYKITIERTVVSEGFSYGPVVVTISRRCHQVLSSPGARFVLLANPRTIVVGTSTGDVTYVFKKSLVSVTVHPIAEFVGGLSSENLGITLVGQTNAVTGDVLEIVFEISGPEVSDGGFGKYCGVIIRSDIVRMSVLYLTINDIVIGCGSLIEKTLVLGVNIDDLLRYVLTKVIMGRLVSCPTTNSPRCGELDIKWALRENYNRLLALIASSGYSGVLPWLKERSNLEVYLR